MSSGQIDNVMQEARLFPPSREFSQRAVIKSQEEYQRLYDAAAKDPEKFWGDLAKQELHWFQPFTQVLDWKPPFAQWFLGGQTNVSYNCLDVHLKTWRKNKAAFIWEGEPGDVRVLTYYGLHRRVAKFAHVLRTLGVSKGDRVAIYLPMIPEAATRLRPVRRRADTAAGPRTTRDSRKAPPSPPAQTTRRFSTPIAGASGRVIRPPATDPKIPPAAKIGNNRLAWRVSTTAPAVPHRNIACTRTPSATVIHSQSAFCSFETASSRPTMFGSRK